MPMTLYTDTHSADTAVDELLDKNGIADALKISPNTVLTYRQQGKPFFSDKGVKVGSSLRWRTSDLREYIDGLAYVID